MSKTEIAVLQSVLTESELCDVLELSKEQIAELRNNKGLPFIKLSQRNRLYFESDLIEFFTKQRVILNKAQDTELDG